MQKRVPITGTIHGLLSRFKCHWMNVNELSTFLVMQECVPSTGAIHGLLSYYKFPATGLWIIKFSPISDVQGKHLTSSWFAYSKGINGDETRHTRAASHISNPWLCVDLRRCSYLVHKTGNQPSKQLMAITGGERPVQPWKPWMFDWRFRIPFQLIASKISSGNVCLHTQTPRFSVVPSPSCDSPIFCIFRSGPSKWNLL